MGSDANWVDLDRIIRAAVLAPSADNSQPWKFEVINRGVRLWVDPFRADSVSDVDRVLTHISCGAVVENMAIQANALGYDTTITPLTDAESPNLICKVEFHPGEPHSWDLARAIPERHTNRRLAYSRRSIGDDLLASLAQEARRIPPADLLWIDTREKRRAALRLMRRAERERFLHRPLHEELFGSIRFDVGWNRTVEEGLPPGALEVEVPARPLFRWLRSWSITRALNTVGLYRVLGWRIADLPSRLAPALGLLTLNEGGTFVDGGRALQRVWLRATASGLAVQPFAAAGILPLQLQTEKPVIAMPVLRDLADRLASLAGHRTGILFLRCGWAMPPSVVAGRREPRSFEVSRAGD